MYTIPTTYLSSPTLSLHLVGLNYLKNDKTVLCAKIYKAFLFFLDPSALSSPTTSLIPREPRLRKVLLYLQICEFRTSPAADLSLGLCPPACSQGYLDMS